MAGMRAQTVHLTDAEFTDVLLGAPAAEVAAHLDGCAMCADEAERVRGAIGSFEQQSRLWAERRAATQSLLSPGRSRVVAWLQRPVGIAAWSAAGLVLVLGTAFGVRHLQETPVTAPVAAARPAQSVAPQRLKTDDELLYAIDGELSSDVTPPASAYGLDGTESRGAGHRGKRVSD